MFVKIINCFPAQYSSNLDRQKAVHSFLEAHGERNHIVNCKKAICEELISCDLYGNLHKKYASDLLEMKRELGSLKSAFDVQLTIDFSLEDDHISSTVNSQSLDIIASYHYLLKSSFKGKCTFLAEDESDCEFYTLIANTIAPIKYGKGVFVKFNNLEGGGARTHKKYVKMLKEHQFGICIVDNDKKHPNGAEGSTSKVFKDTQNQRGYAINQECVVLDFHEAESIIPGVVLKHIVDPSKIDTLDLIERHDSSSNYQFRRFFDHKKGFTLEQGWKLDALYQHSFWKQFFSDDRRYHTKPCRRTSSCINDTHNSECDFCIKIEGLGDKILVDSVQKMRGIHLRPVYSQLTPHIQSQWDSIGRTLINWGCSPLLASVKSF
ncbi:hypothetical protein OH456_06625 [Vibrio sp. La 4.2.2]|uniref:hypothetical protein n=1 Tax=Vibrio sp. La 4.2.2 TaxID=2998830 RepID=UPI0022CDC359|nr:hypothetical protein [Vibrio sp. La 4.2.2]MDA0107809.1 hypothetical protein [Vibrio sp. La 4.2.2]